MRYVKNLGLPYNNNNVDGRGKLIFKFEYEYPSTVLDSEGFKLFIKNKDRKKFNKEEYKKEKMYENLKKQNFENNQEFSSPFNGIPHGIPNGIPLAQGQQCPVQ